MAVNPKGLAYTLVVLLSILLLISILQILQAVQSLRREKAGQPTAPRRSLIFLTTAVVALTISYVFDLVVVALALIDGSETPPPSQAYLVGVVISFFTGNGLAPSMLYASASEIIDSRKDLSGLRGKDAWSIRRRQLLKWTEGFLLIALPILVTAYLGIFSKAVLDTPILARKYYAWLNTANGVYRAAIVVHAFLFQRLATRAISFHLLSKSESTRDPIMRSSILYHFVPSMFIRTAALFVLAPLASSFATSKTPASAAAILLASTFFVGFATVSAAQSLLGAARRPSSEWAPPKSAGEREVMDGDVPGDLHNEPATQRPGHGRKASRADSIALSPTRTSFGGPTIRTEEEHAEGSRATGKARERDTGWEGRRQHEAKKRDESTEHRRRSKSRSKERRDDYEDRYSRRGGDYPALKRDARKDRHNSDRSRRRDSQNRSRSRSPPRTRIRDRSADGYDSAGRKIQAYRGDRNERRREDRVRSKKPRDYENDDSGALMRVDDDQMDRQRSRSRSGSVSSNERKAEERRKPNYGHSGLLAAATNTVQRADGSATVLKYNEPPEARKPLEHWRLYEFKGQENTGIFAIHKQSAYTFGRDAAHAALQYRHVVEKNEFGEKKGMVKPFIIDLESTNGTHVNGVEIPTSRYYELKVNDVIKFGTLAKDFVLLHEGAA
ncbi:hypothetical protein FRC17_009926 [Serendipita sp. 399]|nr:hypothetical protein FRC17_009926 [Serendipita sp. 399]